MTSSDTDSDLSLVMECISSYEANSESSLQEDSSYDENTRARPYMFEPVIVSSQDEGEDQGECSVTRDERRIDNTTWCVCEKCQAMPTVDECRCCQEIAAVREKVEEKEDDQVKCITDHPGFHQVCLSMYAIETAYYHYRQEYGRGEVHDQQIHRNFWNTAYRQLVRWRWMFLGRKVRVPLPACAVRKIREEFPSPEFAEFKYPQMD